MHAQTTNLTRLFCDEDHLYLPARGSLIAPVLVEQSSTGRSCWTAHAPISRMEVHWREAWTLSACSLSP